MTREAQTAAGRSIAAATARARAVVRVSGEDPLAFLHATTSRDLGALPEGVGALTCVLNEKGRIQAEVRVVPLEPGVVLLDGEPACLPALTGWLARIAPLSACDVTDESAAWRLYSVTGDDAATAAGVPALAAEEHAWTRHADGIAVRVEWGAPGVDLLVPASSAPPDLPSRSLDEWDAARIAGGRPVFGIDFDDETLVNETPLLGRAVSLSKGCYPGQESVARVHNLGTPRRKIVALHADGALEAGAVVGHEGADVGTVTSAATGPGGGRALARIRTSVPDGAAVTAGDRPAVAHDLR